MSPLAKKAIHFHKTLQLSIPLPENIRVLNPFVDNPEIQGILGEFYTKFYSDTNKRKLILGINPGRFGAGATGVPFTDTKRLREKCGITSASFQTHEPSSVFVYKVIAAFGGPEKFYDQFYIDSVCPLGFVWENKKGNWVNCNYYDYKSLYKAVKPFIITNLKKQIDFGMDTSVCYSLGKKNAKYLQEINREEHLFDRIVAFPHPRYIVQYKSKEMEHYIATYLDELNR